MIQLTLYFKEISTILTWIIILGLVTIFITDFIFIPLALYNSLKRKNKQFIEKFPLVSIIVPAYNEERIIEDCIKALLEADYPKKEIIIVNDGSTDRTEEIVKPYAIKGKVILINKPRGGKASAINTGISVSNGEIILIIDADSLIQRNAIKYMVSNFKDPKVVAVAGNIKVGNRVNFITKLQALEYIRELQIPKRAFDVLSSILVVPGPLGAYKKEYLIQFGEYDKDTVTEDFDTTIKSLKIGLTVNEPKAIAYTEAPETLKGLYNQRLRWYGGMLQTILKHRVFWWKFRIYGFIGLPYLITTLIIIPLLELMISGIALFEFFIGDWKIVLIAFIFFSILEFLTSLFALTLDNEDLKLAFLSPFYVIGYRQLLDIIRLIAFMKSLMKKVSWSRAERIGGLSYKIKI